MRCLLSVDLLATDIIVAALCSVLLAATPGETSAQVTQPEGNYRIGIGRWSLSTATGIWRWRSSIPR
jgi:hypothetical protein